MKIKNILFLMIAVLAFVSCSDDDEPGIPKYQASALTHPENGTAYELLQRDKNNTVFDLTWTSYKQSELGLGVPTYCVQIDIEGNNFKYAQILSQVTEVSEPTSETVYSAPITVGDLNSMLVNTFSLTPDEPYNVEIRVITRIGDGDGYIPGSASNVFKAVVTPYAAAAVPEAIHLIGNMFGENSWDNSNTKFVMFRTANDEVNTYTGLFASGSEFKFIPQGYIGSWDFTYGGSDGTLSSSGGNITDITAAGYYTVTADIVNLKYTITPYDASDAAEYGDVELIGAFNGWADAGTIKLTKAAYDPHIWTADNVTLTAGELKFRADAGWAVSWGGKTFPYGGGTGDNLTVEDGTYFVKFNDLTGLYVFFSK